MSLLPVNATDLERKLEQSTQQETLLEQRLTTLINIDRIPDRFLDVLAIQFSIDYWRYDWTPSLKRARLKQAFEQHKKKGTPYSIKSALKPFGYEVTMVEWWQTEPKGIPGTFYLELDLVGRVLDESLFKEVNRLVDETKPASRRLSRLTITANPLLSLKNIVAHQSALTSMSEPKL